MLIEEDFVGAKQSLPRGWVGLAAATTALCLLAVALASLGEGLSGLAANGDTEVVTRLKAEADKGVPLVLPKVVPDGSEWQSTGAWTAEGGDPGPNTRTAVLSTAEPGSVWLCTATDAGAAGQCPAETGGTFVQREHGNLIVVFYLTGAAEKTRAFWETVELTEDPSDTWLNKP